LTATATFSGTTGSVGPVAIRAWKATATVVQSTQLARA
jgi:hypothetical protein